MLYEDKFGVFWVQEDLDKLSERQKKELGIVQSYDDEDL